MNEQIIVPELRIESCGDGTLMLEQDTGGNVDRVQVHPLHIRLIAERFGLAPTGDPTAAREIARLRRRLLLVREELALLDSWLRSESNDGQVGMEMMVQSGSIMTLLNEFIHDFEPEMACPATQAEGILGKAAQATNKATAETGPQQLPLA